MGEEIQRLRRRLGIVQPFSPFERYMQYRQRQSANAPGEPRLAVQLLKQLEGE
jgi:hypothetical protein